MADKDLAHSITITDNDVWINGQKLPFHLYVTGPKVEQPYNNVLVVHLPVMLFLDDSTFTDLRSDHG